MEIRFYPYELRLKDEFTLSISSRRTTPVVMVEVEYEGLVGYGEASLPPYLIENQSSVIDFLTRVDLNSFNDPLNIDSILDYVDNLAERNYAAKASIDIALHDLLGKVSGKPLNKYLGITIRDDIYTSYTIGISNLTELNQKIKDASEYKYLKVKLGSENDREIIFTIRELTEKPIFVDVNQGWSDKYFAIDMISWLAEQNVILIEQPLPKDRIEDAIWLKEKSPLPIIADEAVQTSKDLVQIEEAYFGVNIKLMKTGGIREAYKMILKARELNLKILIGCMTETSCAITAAAHLSPLADWVDLDGAELISNDLFSGMKIVDGTVKIPIEPGTGVKKLT